ncbi:hypothetical protein SS05631_c27880 [Sinorhizobium sp. CCBAU 05631]|nr:hypothetical protein SS05631_c27880 [Sinorhizobium sp. CCBAU 05631]
MICQRAPALPPRISLLNRHRSLTACQPDNAYFYRKKTEHRR